MPIKYVCSHCGEVIFEFKYVGQDYYGIPTPQEVYNLYGGVCPHCHNELRIPTVKDITIRPRLYSLKLARIPTSVSASTIAVPAQGSA
ncbi:hypothetical protein [Thermogladius sp.]|uniref:hypothetical protein n=1 Tax=Thermogladius sp. TaxID=2023064 RepID=UPI003D14E6D9